MTRLAARKEALETVIADLEEHRRIAAAKAETARQAAREAEEESAKLVKEQRETVADEIGRLNQSLEAARIEHDEVLSSHAPGAAQRRRSAG